MSRPLSERVRDPMYWVEQAAHFALGGAIAYAFKDAGGWAAWGLSVCLGIVRELIQNLRLRAGRLFWKGSIEDAAVDVLAWTFGASLASLIS